ncbi:hypothetical protein E2F46_15580 [Luteimonas aestuarii]|uniref:General secretion pathway protein GspN n=1 Tax=Luteimonas aestuarii TaxID=453837 RepID=A0A4R5TSU1_9GAMM|nr:hypothetical protein [Luteimonas aestuarii]TDK20631.1 hypothetical protein E2F46_15580 [Luteimonas aestuarii]
MRIAEAAPRTWLLATLAGWALCLWLLALFGMAGSIDRLDEDASLLRPLPGAFEPLPERLGALQQYAEPASRPLFTDDRRPQPFLIDPMAEAGDGGGAFDFVLTSVLRTPSLEMVILQPTDGGRSIGVKVGDAVDGLSNWSLASISSRTAVFNGPDGEMTLELRQFDGVGGEPPTRMSVGASPDPGTAGVRSAMSVPPASANAGPNASAAASSAPTPAVTDANGMPVPQVTEGVAPETTPAARTSPDQVEAIRRRIEERRARLREQAQQNNQTP